MGIRITVNHETCEANGICEQVSDELFHLREDDILQILQPRPETDELVAKAREADRRCPKAALTIVED